LILGSVEAASFSPDQLRMIADFVSKRGGGLLMIGGRRSFAEGGWAGTPVGEVLPVTMEAQPTPNYCTELAARPTPAGRISPVTQIGADEAASEKRWLDFPPITTVNPVHGVKPGATILLSAVDNRKQDRSSGVPALRPWQSARADSGLLAVAHEREDPGHRHDLRHPLAAPWALAG
jgi:hypothetical protein